MTRKLADIIQQNLGNRLTPELAHGLVLALDEIVQQATRPDPGPCLKAAYSSESDGVLVTIDPPWKDPKFAELAVAHAREVWPEGKGLAPSFIDYLAREYLEGRGIPIVALRSDAMNGERLVGYNLLGYAENPLTGEPALGDVALYVAPEFRRGGLGSRLLEAQKDVARQLGVRECFAGYVSPDAEGLHRLYESCGFRRAMMGFAWRP